jgi:hypothetical protein
MGVWAGSLACHFRELSSRSLSRDVPGASARLNWRSPRGTRDQTPTQPVVGRHVGWPGPEDRPPQIRRGTVRNSGMHSTELDRDLASPDPEHARLKSRTP